MLIFEGIDGFVVYHFVCFVFLDDAPILKKLIALPVEFDSSTDLSIEWSYMVD